MRFMTCPSKGKDLRRIDDSNHAGRAMRLGCKGGTIQPDRLIVFHRNGEGLIGRSRSGNGNKTTKYASCDSCWVARVVEIGLYDAVVLGEELEGNLLADLCDNSIWCECEAILADCYSVCRARRACCCWEICGSDVSGRVVLSIGHGDSCKDSDESSRDHVC
jgi:hypothetical protein